MFKILSPRKKKTAEEEPLMDKNVKRTKSSPTWVSDFRYGRSLSLEFFKKNAWLLILLLVVVISLMGLRYKTKTKMLEITRLKKELSHVQSEKLRQKAEYMTLIRETEMLRLVQEKKLGLYFQEEPPYDVIAVDDDYTPPSTED